MTPVDAIGKAYNRRPDGKPPAPPTGRPGFWARLTSEASGGGGYYSWTRLEDDAVTPVDPPVTGTDDAKEVNGVEGIPTGAAGTGTVVWMRKDLADDPDEWRFAYEPGLPPGIADKQILAWDHDPGEWDLILPDETWIDVDLATGELKHIGPGPCCFSGNICGWLETDELGHIRCWYGPGVYYGPCA